MVKHLSLVFVLASIGFGQDEWVVQDNPFSGNDSIVFSDVHAVDSLHVWVVGYNTSGGLWVLSTADGGKVWVGKSPALLTTNSAPMMLNSWNGPCVKFVGTLKGWIGWGWGLLRTEDGGEHWVESHPLSVAISYSDLDFIDSLKGWMISSAYISPTIEGIIQHTENGGKDWVIQDSVNAALHGVCFLDSLKGFVVGDAGTLLRTTDGGSHWTKIATGMTKDLMDIQFADSLHGIAVGDTVLRTIDGGKSWIESGRALGWDVAFPDSLHAWTASLWFTIDGGASWSWEEPGINIPGPLNGVSFPDTSHGWAVGEYGTIIHYGPKVGIGEEKGIQRNTYCLDIRPNPSKRLSTIEFQIPTSGYVALQVYDATGSLICQLLAEHKTAGSYKIGWNKGNLASGIYFLKLDLNNIIKVCKKIVLIN